MASEDDNMSGYAWSDNIGWISFNCEEGGGGHYDSCGTSDYGGGIGGDQKLSGYAWSDNIGWISFNEDDLIGCSNPPCGSKLNGTELKGWARALSGGDDPNDGWDGWISLSTQPSDAFTYGVELNVDTLEFEGYAWSDNIGWISFNCQDGGAGQSDICSTSDYGTFFGGELPLITYFQVISTETGTEPYAEWTAENVVSCDLEATNGYSKINVCTGTDCLDVTGPDKFRINKSVEEETTYTLTCFSDAGLSTFLPSTPYKFFELSANPSKVTIDFVGNSATTTPTDIGVISYNGFKDSVSFSADVNSLPSSPLGGEISSANFSRLTLPYVDYSAGVKSNLEIFAAYRFIDKVTVPVSGNGGGRIESINITIDAGDIEPVYEEI